MAALNFPANPLNGDEFEGYVYDSTLGVWNRKPSTVAYTVSANAPINPNDGDVWFNEQDGSSYIYYTDSDSEQWVEIGGKVGATGAAGANGADGRFVNSATKPSSAVDGDVWFNTNNGKIFVYYDDGDTSQWVESGSRVLAFDTLANLSDTNISSPVDGQALVYDSSSSKWVAGNAAPSGVNTLNSDSISLDFSDNVPLEQRSVAGDVTFTASNYSAGAKKTIYLEGDTVQRTLTFPAAWNFITDKPTAIGASKKNVLDLNSFGTSESTTVAIWLGASSFEPMQAIGGSETEISMNGVTYKVHTFTTSASFEVTDLGTIAETDILVVAGGGGSGQDLGGGGGGGGLAFAENYTLGSAKTYNVTIGAGGGGGSGTGPGGNGSQSSFDSIITAIGGGGGSSWSGGAGRAGGSGGGSTAGGGNGGASLQTSGVGYLGYGYPGGNAVGGSSANDYAGSSGGGGAGGAGGNGSTSAFGANSTSFAYGGAGLAFAISGNSIVYATGGPGNSNNGSHYGAAAIGGVGINTNGIANTGGGAGGANGTLGFSGGSGIVIIRYPLTDPN